MQPSYSFIIPVYNRPEEIDELLKSLVLLEGNLPFEVVIVEDGSSMDCKNEVAKYASSLSITYCRKENTGPGDSRNYGMNKAKAPYFIILDSDCILPQQYLVEVHKELQDKHVDFWGGPDAAHHSFSKLQKAINYAMTAFLTTGGIRGNVSAKETFQPRSFNMGISRAAFKASGGFGDIHPGEDPDLVLRLWKQGFKSRLFLKAFVYHKRRISWSKFYKQVHKFGLVRPILNKWHPGSAKLTFWFPTFFILAAPLALLIAFLGFPYFLFLYAVYLILIFLHSSITTRSLAIGSMAVWATIIQFYGYGLAFLKSTILIGWMNKLSRKQFPHLFFK